MIIKASHAFQPCKGTVFVVVYSGGNVAQGVFKGLPAARLLKARMESVIIGGTNVAGEIRVGHFNDAGDIETI